MVYRVSAGSVPASSWIQDLEVGGGRIIGEGCHFIDYMAFVCGSLPVKVYASALPDPRQLNDAVSVNIEFANGSTGVLLYCSNASKAMEKEYFEVHHAGTSVVLKDFRTLEIYGRKTSRIRLWSQNKGQAEMVAAFFNAIAQGRALIPFAELRAVTLASFAVMESLREKSPVEIR